MKLGAARRLSVVSRSLRFTASAVLAVAGSAVGVAAEEGTYPDVVPGSTIEFPRDAGSHPEYRIEWWYVTGWLEAADGNPLGFQVTFFRSRQHADDDNPSRFAVRQLLFAHAALSDPSRGSLLHAQRAARGGFGLAQAATDRTDVVLEDWRLEDRGGVLHARVTADDFAFDLEIARTQPPLLQGDAGFSRKGRELGSASYYYSLPHLEVSGHITDGGRSRKVNGTAWLDHEWSSRILEPEAVGWDWAGINLANGGAVMAFRLRDAAGAQYWAAGTWREPDGAVTTFGPDGIAWQPGRTWRSPRTGIEYPVEFAVRVGNRRLHIEPLLDDQESDSRASTGTIYWEGAIRARGEDGALAGRGYLELTGYGARLVL